MLRGAKNTRSWFRSAVLCCALVEALASTACLGTSPAAQPVADNRTAHGRAQNRRVVFRIIGKSAIENRQQGADDTTRENERRNEP